MAINSGATPENAEPVRLVRGVAAAGRLRKKLAMAALGLAPLLEGCGGGGGGSSTPSPPPPAAVSVEISGATEVEEAGNPRVQVTVRLDTPASGAVTVALNLAGTAERDRDYALGEDELSVAANATSASAEIDIYRDFEEEGDETIEVSLGAISGDARAGNPASVTLTVLDGPPAMLNKMPSGNGGDGGGDDGSVGEDAGLELVPLGFDVTEEHVVVILSAEVAPGATDPVPLVAEWSSDPGFNSGVNVINECYAPPEVDPFSDALSGPQEVQLVSPCAVAASEDPFSFFFGNIRIFRLPFADLAPSERYFFRAWLGEPPPSFELGATYPNAVVNSFATNAEGRLAVRCEAPDRTPAAGAADPLFDQQWHLVNTGQTAFSDRGGVAGADLRMTGAIGAGHSGAGVKLAVVDSGLEGCHPDLAANAASGGSFNFAAESRPGAASDDPFNIMSFGDHGTAVAGVAAAVADNGLGGRGVAPGATLVAFNPLEAAPAEENGDIEMAAEIALMKSLGASADRPDSASVDVFNLSFGADDPGQNASEEFSRVFRTGTRELRGGRGAVYVKAAGNAFSVCDDEDYPLHHPLHREVGCVGSNSDPDQNLSWLIAVGGFNADDVKSSYSSAGANLWVVGPSGEDGEAAPAIITTDQAAPDAGYNLFPENRLTAEHPLNRDGDYVSGFGGTSAATPAVAGAVAVLLGERPELTWRDVKHILASTARRIDPDRAEVRAAFNGTPYVAQHGWQTNAAGYAFHNWYGFGAVDVDAALAMAAGYTPDSLGALVESDWFGAGEAADMPGSIPDADGAGVSATLDVTGLPEGADIEAVVLEISVDHAAAFDLGVTLRSPAGTASVLNPPFNVALEYIPGFASWRLLSNAFYGEDPNGTWTLHVADLAAADTGGLTGWRLRIYYGEHGAN